MDRHASKPQDRNTLGRVLVIEDDAAVLMMLAEVLGECGYYIASAGRPEQAHQLVHEFRPDVVVIGTDGRGTFERGWRLAALLRYQLPRMPLIMMSTSDAAVAEVGVTERGRLFDTALLKPFRIGELAARIQCLMHMSSATSSASRLPLSTFGSYLVDQ